MDTDEAKYKYKKYFSWEKILENLPFILAVGGGVLILDKLIGIGAMLEPMFKKRRRWKKKKTFEAIDTAGDNIQIIDSLLKLVGLELDGDELKKVGDFLQNVGTGGKLIVSLYELMGIGGGSKGVGGYKQLN